MMVGENGPEIDGWKVQPGRHCGQLCVDLACPTCGEWVTVPKNITLSDN